MTRSVPSYSVLVTSYCDSLTRMVVVCHTATQPSYVATYQNRIACWILNMKKDVSTGMECHHMHTVFLIVITDISLHIKNLTIIVHMIRDLILVIVGYYRLGWTHDNYGKPLLVPQLGIKLNDEWIVRIPNAHNASVLISNYVSGTSVQFCFEPGNNSNAEAYISAYSY